MDNEDVIKINLENASAVARGVYTGLLCPKCKRYDVEAFFSEHNLKSGYGIWFECKNCKNVEHISCKSQPDGFSPLRVSERFQELDERGWEAEE
jgi:hypothetical protein